MPSSILDVNPLEHLSSDIAISNYNYESIMNGLVGWNNSKQSTITIRLATNTPPYYVDYVIPTRYSYDTNSGSSSAAKGLKTGEFSYTGRYQMTCAYSGGDRGEGEVDTTSDQVTLRFTVGNLDGSQWDLYEDVTCYDEIVWGDDPDVSDQILATSTYTHNMVKGLFFRASLKDATTDRYYTRLYKTTDDVKYGDQFDSTNSTEVVGEVDPTGNYVVGTTIDVVFWICNHPEYKYRGVYIRDEKKSQQPYPVYKTDSGFVKLCDLYKEGGTYNAGDLVYYNGEFFICLEDGTAATPFHDDVDEPNEPQQRRYATTYWASVIVLPTGKNIDGSGVVRYTITTDLNGFILRKVKDSGDDSKMFINILGSRAIPSGETKQHSGVDIFSTSNYVKWPALSAKWVNGANYRTDDARSTYLLQDYSATMVFSHKDPSVKYKNIINYDGPDLDQGLCIFLPVDVIEEEKLYVPENGTMFEFLFRIWPNPQYNGNQDNDLIINKSQIYVYSADSMEAIDNMLTGGTASSRCAPIAKFSMARLTNFYVKSETIGVPDRPVMYKARFIYSKDEHRWKTYDYYQFPDHVFLSPGGFVDPMKQNEYGVETAGFPLYQDPFCSYDLTPVKVTPNYRNQLKI